MVKTCFQMIFPNDLRSQKVKVKSVLDYLKNEIPSLAEDDLYDLRIIYTELLTNAIVHGNRHDSTKKVELSIEVDDNAIVSVIKDEGHGFDYSNIFKATGLTYEVLLEHGRGLKLVICLADFVKWNDIGNEIMFKKNIHV